MAVGMQVESSEEPTNLEHIVPGDAQRSHTSTRMPPQAYTMDHVERCGVIIA